MSDESKYIAKALTEIKADLKELRGTVSDLKSFVNPKIAKYGHRIKSLEENFKEHKEAHTREEEVERTDSHYHWDWWFTFIIIVFNLIGLGLTVAINFF